MQIDDLIVVLQKIYDNAVILVDDSLRALDVAKGIKLRPPPKENSVQVDEENKTENK